MAVRELGAERVLYGSDAGGRSVETGFVDDGNDMFGLVRFAPPSRVPAPPL